MTNEMINKMVALLLGWEQKFGKMDSASGKDGVYWVRGSSRTSVLPDWVNDPVVALPLLSELLNCGAVVQSYAFPDSKLGYRISTPDGLGVYDENMMRGVARMFIMLHIAGGG